MGSVKRIIATATTVMIGGVLALDGAQGAELAAGAAVKDRSATQPCIQLAMSFTPNKKPGSKGASSLIKIDRNNKALLKPITRAEVKLLIEALTPVKLKDGKGYEVPGAAKGSPLSIERMGVLMQDITAILARVHLQETLETLRGMPAPKNMPGPFAKPIAWGSGVGKMMDLCAGTRYADFGGIAALREATEIVLGHRSILESLVLETKLPQGEPPGGERPGSGPPGGERPGSGPPGGEP